MICDLEIEQQYEEEEDWTQEQEFDFGIELGFQRFHCVLEEESSERAGALDLELEEPASQERSGCR